MLDSASFRTLATGPIPDICICGQLIPDGVWYYGFPLSTEAEQPMAFINSWHDHCLGEWGWRRDDSEFGITHDAYCYP